jgi:transposase
MAGAVPQSRNRSVIMRGIDKALTRFSRWAKSGVWKKVFEMLASDADNEYAMIDSTIERAHQHSAGAQKKTVKTRRSDAAKAG